MFYPELSSLTNETPYLSSGAIAAFDEYLASIHQTEADSITVQFTANAIHLPSATASTLLDHCAQLGLLLKGVQFICPVTHDLLDVFWPDDEILQSLDCRSCDASHQTESCGSQNIYKLLKVLAVVPRKTNIDAASTIVRLFDRFHAVATQLTQRHAGRRIWKIDDEYDVQDLLHALLRVHFDDIRPEEWTPSYAAGASRIDFVLKAEKIIIEVKKTRQNLGAKAIADQLIIDIARYQTHPDCGHLFCFVYDPDHVINNHTALETDLSKNNSGMEVTVLIRPSLT